MKYEIRPFVMLNDIEGIYEFADENPSPVPFSVDTIRIGYPIVDYGRESYENRADVKAIKATVRRLTPAAARN